LLRRAPPVARRSEGMASFIKKEWLRTSIAALGRFTESLHSRSSTVLDLGVSKGHTKDHLDEKRIEIWGFFGFSHVTLLWHEGISLHAKGFLHYPK
jgi:hypothetical protein